MRVMLVQGTWGDNDSWWRVGTGGFADAVVAAGHTLINGRPFEWSTDLGGVGFGARDRNVWRAAGRHLYDRLDPVQCPADLSDLVIIAHSHGRQVVKYACHAGLRAHRVIFVSGPIRKDVDQETGAARSRMGSLICLNGGQHDTWQWLGEMFDGHFGVRRRDPDADVNLTFKDADHGSLLRDHAQFARILEYVR